MEWNLTDAQNKLNEVIDKALQEGPQKITRRQDSVILIEEGEYKRLLENKKSFKDHLFQGPSFDDLDLSRDKSTMREIDL